MSDAGFIFWGLLGILAGIVVGYAVWVWWIERRESSDGSLRRIPGVEEGCGEETSPNRIES
jgi:hypothetical protein